MRLFVTAILLACAPCAHTQAQGVSTPDQRPTITPQTPTPGQPIRRIAATGRAPESVKGPDVPPTTTVVTLQGVCKDRQAKGGCKTVVTRGELDAFASTSARDASDAARGRVAVQYARTLAFSTLAEQQGLEKNPVLAKEIETQVNLLRTRMLASAFVANLQKQLPDITEGDIQKYFEVHRDQFEHVQVLRLAVPFLVPTEDGRRLDRPAAQAAMEEIRARAAAGEDMNLLQQELFKQLHIQAPAPAVTPMTLQRRAVHGEEAKAFELQPGEITGVLDLPAAFAIMKVESKGASPLPAVRQEIQTAIGSERMQNAISKLGSKISAQFNLQYLDLATQPELFSVQAIVPATRVAPRRLAGARK